MKTETEKGKPARMTLDVPGDPWKKRSSPHCSPGKNTRPFPFFFFLLFFIGRKFVLIQTIKTVSCQSNHIVHYLKMS